MVPNKLSQGVYFTKFIKGLQQPLPLVRRVTKNLGKARVKARKPCVKGALLILWLRKQYLDFEVIKNVSTNKTNTRYICSLFRYVENVKLHLLQNGYTTVLEQSKHST